MRSITLIFLCSFSSLAAHAGNKDYFVYHSYVNLAEYHLVNDHPDSVFYYYDKVFTEFDFIFAKDAVIAAQFAWKQKNSEKTCSYLIKGAGSGLRSSCLNEFPILKGFASSKDFTEIVYDKMLAARQQFEFSLDNDMRTEWVQWGDELVMALATREFAEFMNTIVKGVGRIDQLMKDGIFPGEKYIGLSEYCSELSNTNAYYLLVNYDCVITEMHDQLWKAVKDGTLHPREFASLWEWEYLKATKNAGLLTRRVLAEMGKKNISGYFFSANSNTNFECEKSKQRFKIFNLIIDSKNTPASEINTNRESYYICNLDTDEKKGKLQISEGYVFYFVYK